MRVRATRLGYYNHLRRREGDVFDIKDEPKHKNGTPVAFSSKWMEQVDPSVKTKISKASDVRKAEALSQVKSSDVLPTEPTGDSEVI